MEYLLPGCVLELTKFLETKMLKMKLVLEALECSNPLPCPYSEYRDDIGVSGIAESKRIIPAGWWSLDNLQWVEVVTLRIWQIWRLFRIRSPHYWPLRIRLGERILWISKAALQQESF